MINELTSVSITHPIEQIDLKEYEPGGKYFNRKDISSESPAAILTNIYGIYKIMRPVFKRFSSFPGVSTHWKEAIRTYIGFMDTICK